MHVQKIIVKIIKHKQTDTHVIFRDNMIDKFKKGTKIR